MKEGFKTIFEFLKNKKAEGKLMEMRKASALILALTLAASTQFAGCAARRPQNPTQVGYGNYNTTNPGNGLNNNWGVNRTGMNSNYGNNGIGGNNNNYGYNNGYGYNYGQNYNNNALNDNRLGTNPNNTNSLNGGILGNGNTESDLLARACNTVPGVNGATVVVSGDTAYVGVDVDTANTANNTGNIAQIKKQCADKVRAADPNVKQVTVSADADFLQRIQMINQGIRRGTPVESFRNELTQMVKRITPERE